MNYGVFFKFSHPTPNTLTLLAYDLQTLQHVPGHPPKIVDLLNKGATTQVLAWFEWFGRKKVTLVTNGSTYHYPLLYQIMGKNLDQKALPTIMDINTLALFLNLASPSGQELIVNDDDQPATGVQWQRKFFKLQASAELMPAAAVEYTDLLDVVNVYVAHTNCMRMGAVTL